MSQFNENYKNMRITGSLLNKEGERIRVDTIDRRLGAYTVYNELKNAFIY
jgi:hypothetical protein